MVTRCLFGIFVFGSNSSVIYRFLTDDLYTHLRQRFQARAYKLNDDPIEDNQVSILHSFSYRYSIFFYIIKKVDNTNDNELTLSVDDAISQHLNVLIRVHEQTISRHDPIRRITLESGIQVFFDQV